MCVCGVRIYGARDAAGVTKPNGTHGIYMQIQLLVVVVVLLLVVLVELPRCAGQVACGWRTPRAWITTQCCVCPQCVYTLAEGHTVAWHAPVDGGAHMCIVPAVGGSSMREHICLVN